MHPNQSLREKTKNKGAIIPDIIANKNGISLFFENKDRFVLSDFEKLNHVKISGEYNNSISDLLNKYPTDVIYYGIGLPYLKSLEKRLAEHDHLIDFVVSVSPTFEIEILKGRDIFNSTPSV